MLLYFCPFKYLKKIRENLFKILRRNFKLGYVPLLYVMFALMFILHAYDAHLVSCLHWTRVLGFGTIMIITFSSFNTSNGIQRSESGTLVNEGQPDEHVEVFGFYSYTDPDGKLVEIRYTADENGYHILMFPRPMVSWLML